MKTIWIKTALLMSLIASTGAITLASGGRYFPSEIRTESELPSSTENLLRKEFFRRIRKMLENPEFESKSGENRVEVVIRIDQNGQTIVDSISGSDEVAVDFVKQKIESMQWMEAYRNSTHHFAIRFHHDIKL